MTTLGNSISSEFSMLLIQVENQLAICRDCTGSDLEPAKHTVYQALHAKVI